MRYGLRTVPRKWLYRIDNVQLEWYGSETVPPAIYKQPEHIF